MNKQMHEEYAFKNPYGLADCLILVQTRAVFAVRKHYDEFLLI